MPTLRYLSALDDAVLATGLEAIRAQLELPERFSADAAAEAELAARRGPRIPPGAAHDHWDDHTHLELVAIDPAGSRDLDQAFAAERRAGGGYRVWYAIADVAAFVVPGGPLEAQTLERGVTLYGPDRRIPLHPTAISEQAASLLAGGTRPSCLWRIDLDDDGACVDAQLTRSTVRVRQALSYRDAQRELDGSRPREILQLLREIGERRQALEIARGAVSLNLPSQEIQRDPDGNYRLVFDQPLPVEGWNAQISLLTGITAASMMIDAGIGILRTLPPADPDTIAELRRTAAALGIDWPDDRSYPDRIRSLDPSDPHEAALTLRSARALRGAGYAAFTTPGEIPDAREHSAIASTYAHVTAPLRRVCDRYANEALLSHCAGAPTPDWVLERLPALPEIMGDARSRERSYERTVVDYMEAVILDTHVGEHFDATVISHRRGGAVVQIAEPAVIAEIDLDEAPALGSRLVLELTDADPIHRRLTFTPGR